jgi:hypothetical protein
VADAKTEIVQFRTRAGAMISIEAERTEASGGQRVARGERMVAQAAASLEDALSSIRPALECVLQDLQGMVDQPD